MLVLEEILVFKLDFKTRFREFKDFVERFRFLRGLGVGIWVIFNRFFY